ncbi:GatB/YqeY domain-containing protein [Candidatus Omnitrophota bacterium]
MGTLEERILKDYKEAMKSKDSLKSSALNFLRAQLLNTAKEKRKEALDDAEVIAVIKKQVKQRQDSIEQFKKGNRQDLVEKETKELEILQSFLPAQLSPEKIGSIVEEVIKELDATSMKDMGSVMKEVKERTASAADGKTVSEIVKSKLMPKKTE